MSSSTADAEPAQFATGLTIRDMTVEDLPFFLAGTDLAFPAFQEAFEPLPTRPPPAVRVANTTHRLLKVLASPHTLCRVALWDGDRAGITLWHTPGAPIFNLKRRLADRTGESDRDRESWEGVAPFHEETWGAWDRKREEIMRDRKHWYLAPIWVLPQYKGKGIGVALLQEAIVQADQDGAAMYLEASPEDKVLYERRGFVVEGKSEYVEMVRWGTQDRPDWLPPKDVKDKMVN